MRRFPQAMEALVFILCVALATGIPALALLTWAGRTGSLRLFMVSLCFGAFPFVFFAILLLPPGAGHPYPWDSLPFLALALLIVVSMAWAWCRTAKRILRVRDLMKGSSE